MSLHAGLLGYYAGLPGWAQTTLRLALVLVVGWLLVRLATGSILWLLQRNRHVDATLKSFLSVLLRALGYIMLVLLVISMAGVDVTALLGGLTIGGFVLGFALKDSLGNLAAGFVLLVYRPFSVGDFVEIDGYMGTVEELGLTLTRVRRFDGVIVTLPNGKVLDGPIVNFTRARTRRLAASVGISYDDDVDKASKALLEAANAEPRILAEPAAEVVITRLGENSVELELRAWVMPADFGAVNSRLPALAKSAVESVGCSIPFPHREVHVYQHGASGG